MSQTLSLYRLQQIDIQIDRAQARLDDIQEILEDDTELRDVKEKAEAEEVHYQSAEQALKLAENAVQIQFIKIEQTQSSLYGAKAHSPKELQDLQNELAALKRYLLTLEDRQIEAMQESETAETNQKSAQVRLNNLREQRLEQRKGLLLEQETIKSERERLFTERKAVAGAIPATELGLYDQLRLQRRGVAVAVIGDNACGACGSALSLAQIQTSRSSSQMILCPSCGRILYGS
jgi:predicted  nucleic acid-binding Zn-ribbon protein